MMWMMNRKPQAPAGGVAEKQAELARLQSEIDQVRGQRSQVGDGTGTSGPVR